ncbi:MAG: oxidative damage protection protein [Legionella sp.]|jgi:Fe-S cluster biosynthesis and repair protein YggX|nr:oxidative damage protection protein [Legionella sp.]
MSNLIFCSKLKQELNQMEAPPFPGKLGDKIFNQISQAAWQQWLQHQTMLINEYRLALIDPKARTFLQEEMEKYFFGEGSTPPAGFSEKN